MTRRHRASKSSEQLPLPAPPPKPKRPAIPTPEQVAKGSIGHRAKPSAVPGNVKLTLTFDIPRQLAEQLTAQAVREGVNLETVIERLMRAELKG